MPTPPGGLAVALRSARLPNGRDLLPLLLGGLSLLVYLLRGFDGYLSTDVGTYAYAGQMVADGNLPYERQVNRVGPLSHWVPGLGVLAARAVGVSDLFGARVLFMLLSVAAVVATYYLARDVFSSRAVGAAAAISLIAFRFFTIYATAGPREKTLVVLLMLLAWLAAHHRRWLVAGVMVGLATLTWQITFVWLGPSVALAALLSGAGRWRALLRYAAGGLGALAVCVLPFAVRGRVDLFVEGFWSINRHYSASAIGVDPRVLFWPVLRLSYGPSAYLVALGLLATLVLMAGAATGLVPRDASGRISALMIAAGSLCGGIWTALVFDGNSDTLPLLPGAALSLGALVAAVGVWRPRTGRVAMVVLCAVATGLVARALLNTPIVPVSLQKREVAVVFDRLPKDATLLVAGAPEVSVLADRPNPTRFQRFSHGLWAYLDDSWPGGQEGYFRWIERNRATVLAVRPGVFRMQMRRRGGLDGYVLLGPGRDWYWYVDTEATSHRQRVAIRQELLARHGE